MLNLLLVDFKTSCYYSIKPAVVSGSLAPSSVHVTNPQDTADLASHFPPANFDQIPVLSTRVYRGTVLSESQVPFQYDLDYNSIISQRIRWHMTYRRVPLAVSAWMAMLTRINLNNRWTRTISTVSSSLSLFRHTYQIRPLATLSATSTGSSLPFPNYGSDGRRNLIRHRRSCRSFASDTPQSGVWLANELESFPRIHGVRAFNVIVTTMITNPTLFSWSLWIG